MELSVDVQNLLERYHVRRNRGDENPHPDRRPNVNLCDTISDTIIDINKINFSSDETWLYESPIKSSGLRDVSQNSEEDEMSCLKSESDKSFDSRTFTRPKKRYSRPSIEKYNEELYGNDRNSSLPGSPKASPLKKCEEEPNELGPVKPLVFDLAQPTTSGYFEKMLAGAPDVESFQNMSPPSLVNSMCSSTFANLMENSYIKNDPLLREIRDTDFTDSVLLQDSEPPLFQSITESCSSLNSDSAENFLRKLSITGSFRKKKASKEIGDAEINEMLNCTFDLNKSNDSPDAQDSSHLDKTVIEVKQETEQSSPRNTHGTYKRPSKYATYRKSDGKMNNPQLDSTFDVSCDNDVTLLNSDLSSSTEKSTSSNNTSTLNTTITIESPKLKRRFEKSQAQRREAMETMKQQLNADSTETDRITDMNRLNYYEEQQEKELREDTTYVNKRQSVMGSSTGSADSLDRMSSSLSNSSRGSNRMLNMAEVDAIVERQEQSLHIMSTPKHRATKKLWDNNYISPIMVSEPYSDSDQSSNDDFKSARSTLSAHTNIKSAKSLSYIPSKPEPKKSNLKSINTLTSTRNLQSMANTFRGSYTNLKSAVNSHNGPQPQLTKTGGNLRGSHTNLKTVDSVLRGSYTSLRPLSAVSLPVAPPPIQKNLNTTITTKPTNPNGTYINIRSSKVAEVPPIPRETPSGDDRFVKPAPPRQSGLPRPVGTGIPRPMSRIPGPRKVRPSSAYQPRTGEGY